jgi:putative endonuclease
MYAVYIIYSERIDKYYIGFSSNVQERLCKHNRNSKGFSSSGRPWILVYTEGFDNKKVAMVREKNHKPPDFSRGIAALERCAKS